MVTTLKLGDVSVDVVKKDIKNLHLSVHPPTGRVRIAAPLRMDLDTIRVFALTKLDWIKTHQKKLRQQDRETPREYLDRESHYVWGKRYLMEIVEAKAPPKVTLKHNQLVLQVRTGASEAKKREVLDAWYRGQLKTAVVPLIEKWQRPLGVSVERFFVQKMKTKWGSCNDRTGTIRLNTELAKKPPECLEFIVLHEMLHLIERHHNDRFTTLMDRHMPTWRHIRQTLNEAPLGHVEWGY